VVVLVVVVVVVVVVVINHDDDDYEDHMSMDRVQRNGIWSWERLVKYSLFQYP